MPNKQQEPGDRIPMPMQFVMAAVGVVGMAVLFTGLSGSHAEMVERRNAEMASKLAQMIATRPAELQTPSVCAPTALPR